MSYTSTKESMKLKADGWKYDSFFNRWVKLDRTCLYFKYEGENHWVSPGTKLHSDLKDRYLNGNKL